MGCAQHSKTFPARFVNWTKASSQQIPLVPCPKCKKEFCSKESLKAHNIIHIGLELLKKAKQRRQKVEQNLAAKRFAKGKPGKSAPAKLIPSKSLRAKQRNHKHSTFCTRGISPINHIFFHQQLVNCFQWHIIDMSLKTLTNSNWIFGFLKHYTLITAFILSFHLQGIFIYFLQTLWKGRKIRDLK